MYTSISIALVLDRSHKSKCTELYALYTVPHQAEIVGLDESPANGHSSILVEVSRKALLNVELACSLATQFLHLFVEVHMSVEVYS